MNKCIFLLIFLCILVVVSNFVYVPKSAASNLVYSENFDDGKINAPSFGTFHVVHEIFTTAKENIHWEIGSAGCYGGGKCFKAKPGAGNDSHFVWNTDQKWPTDEWYLSYWIKYTNVSTPINNLKNFYPHFGGGYIHHAINANFDSFWFTWKCGDGTIAYQNKNISGVNPGDGAWHHYEYWMKFSTGQLKFWYDGKLKVNEDDKSYCWSNNPQMKFLDYDSGSTDSQVQWMDNIEVWDGMPSGGAPKPLNPPPPPPSANPTPEPNPPTGLKIVVVD